MANDNITSLLEKLQLAAEGNDSDLETELEKLIESVKGQDDSTDLCQELINNGVLVSVAKALESGSNAVQAKAAEFVAELAKIEQCRLSCIMNGLIPLIVDKMSSENTCIALQACRALGNICYEHDGGRISVIECNGTGKLMQLLRRAAGLNESPENHQLRLVSTGFLLNFLNAYDTLQDQVMEMELVEVLCEYLDKYADDEDIPTHVLLSLSCMADTEMGRELILSKNISPQLVEILKTNFNAEVTETCLELIFSLSEVGEHAKSQLTSGGVCDAIVDVIHRYQESAPDYSDPIIKYSADLIVHILAGDESMKTVYANGNGKIYKEFVEWLTCPVLELQSAAALGIGNFARNDDHCINMMNNGIAKKMLSVLASNNSGDGDIRLQHAFLSALRNLSIAEVNKPLLVEQGALDILLPMAVSLETYPVVFKLLATLRMIIDGQKAAAIKLGESEEVIKKIVKWCAADEHPGVKGEATRILAWILKNSSGSKPVIKCLVNLGAVFHLAAMLRSEHAVMVNEAALGLALIFAEKSDSELVAALDNVPLMENFVTVLKNPLLPPEIWCNVLSGLVALQQSETTKAIVEHSQLKSVLEELSAHSNEDLRRLATVLIV